MSYKYTDEAEEHLHSLEGKPLLGTSSVAGMVPKVLTYWASGLACEKFGWTNSKTTKKEERLLTASVRKAEIQSMNNQEYLKLLDDAYKAHSVRLEKAADAGTDMHAVLENYVRECMLLKSISEVSGADKYLVEFSKWAVEHVDSFVHSEANVYSKEMWTGGITDLVMKMKDGRYVLGDFKSSKEAYDNHFIQIAGYDLQQQENGFFDADGKKIGEKVDINSYIVFPFGSKEFEPVEAFNTEQLQNGFKACLVLYKIIKQK